MANESPTITDQLVEEVAREADVIDRSVYRRMLGLEVRGRAGVRTDRALEARGLARCSVNPTPKAG